MNSPNSPTMTRTFPSHMPGVRRAAFATLLVALLAFVGAFPVAADRLPDLGECDNLRIEAGNRLALHVYAEGVQIYRWDGATWVFVGPSALLFADPGGHGIVGTHYAGPTWESMSGSKVVGSVVDRCTPDPDAIPWLELRAVSSQGPGIFAGVTFIQRTNTVGGKAPAQPGGEVGEIANVPYSAEYYFYKARN